MHAALSTQVKHCYIEISFSVNNNNASQKAELFHQLYDAF